MGDGRPSALCADLAGAIGELVSICLDLTSWADREHASMERIEPLIKAVDGAVFELRVGMSLLRRLEQLPDIRPVGGRFPSLDGLAEHARQSDPAIPDGILLRLQHAIVAARAAYGTASARRRVTMDADALREQERLLAAEYGTSELPKPCAGEDLRCDDAEDIEHWACVYSELADFAHRVLEGASTWSPNVQRTVSLNARFRDLRLAYWTDRLNRVRGEDGPDRDHAV